MQLPSPFLLAANGSRSAGVGWMSPAQVVKLLAEQKQLILSQSPSEPSAAMVRMDGLEAQQRAQLVMIRELQQKQDV